MGRLGALDTVSVPPLSIVQDAPPLQEKPGVDGESVAVDSEWLHDAHVHPVLRGIATAFLSLLSELGAKEGGEAASCYAIAEARAKQLAETHSGDLTRLWKQQGHRFTLEIRLAHPESMVEGIHVSTNQGPVVGCDSDMFDVFMPWAIHLKAEVTVHANRAGIHLDSDSSISFVGNGHEFPAGMEFRVFEIGCEQTFQLRETLQCRADGGIEFTSILNDTGQPAIHRWQDPLFKLEHIVEKQVSHWAARLEGFEAMLEEESTRRARSSVPHVAALSNESTEDS